MTPIRVVAADDEPLALDRLRGLLAEIDGVKIIAEAGSGEEVIAAVELLRPDLVILDIEMPKVDGFDVIESISRMPSVDPLPLVAFVTAFPQFALQAFDTGAIDFLAKPVRLSRLEKMIERARQAVALREAAKRLEDLKAKLGELRGVASGTDQRTFWIRHRDAVLRIATADIDWIKAEGPYAVLHVGERSHLIRSPIGELAGQLVDEGFLQIHRSALVNAQKVEGLSSGRYGMKLLLRGGIEVPVGRKYRAVARRIVGG